MMSVWVSCSGCLEGGCRCCSWAGAAGFRQRGLVVFRAGVIVNNGLTLQRSLVVASLTVLAHGSMPWESRTMVAVAVQGAPALLSRRSWNLSRGRGRWRWRWGVESEHLPRSHWDSFVGSAPYSYSPVRF